MVDLATLANPAIAGAGPANERKPQQAGDDSFLPEGLKVVSSDNHWEVTEDIFYNELPDHLKDDGPRVWWDKFWNVAPKPKGGERASAMMDEDSLLLFERIMKQDGFEFGIRGQHMRAEGVQQEIAYPNSLMAFAYIPDLEMREQIAKIYNRYIARLSRENPEFFGVGICPNWWDPSKAKEMVQEIVDLGLKTFMLPCKLRLADGKQVSLADPLLDNFWAEVEASGMPLSIHIGEPTHFPGRGGVGIAVTCSFEVFRRPLAELIWGGVFDRRPNLQVVFSEGGIAWVAPALQDAELIYDTWGPATERPLHRPSYYWHKNCYATFSTDQVGLRTLDLIGADRVMWAADYPHSEGTFGYSRESLRQVVKATTEAEARLILGDTASQLYKLD